MSVSEPFFLDWSGWSICADPDLDPDVFWVLGGDGLPIAIGLFPASDVAPNEAE